MNDAMAANVVCPYYIRHSRSERQYTISCEFLMTPESLGFTPELRIGFKEREDFKDYIELFCCDRFRACPVFKAILRERNEG